MLIAILIVLALLVIGIQRVHGYEIQFTAEFRHSETFEERVREWAKEKISEMGKMGCVRGVLIMGPKPEDENVTVAQLKCIEFEKPQETKGGE